MKRFFIEKFEIWFDKANRKPLVLSGARQVGKEDKRFVSSEVKDEKGGPIRSRDLKDSFEWFEAAGVAYRVWNVTTPNVPISSYQGHVFKLFGVDVGLLALQSGLSPRSVLEDGDRFFKEFKDSLTEQFVQQELRARHGMDLHYWSRVPRDRPAPSTKYQAPGARHLLKSPSDFFSWSILGAIANTFDFIVGNFQQAFNPQIVKLYAFSFCGRKFRPKMQPIYVFS